MAERRCNCRHCAELAGAHCPEPRDQRLLLATNCGCVANLEPPAVYGAAAVEELRAGSRLLIFNPLDVLRCRPHGNWLLAEACIRALAGPGTDCGHNRQGICV